MTMTDTLSTLCVTCHDNARRKDSKAVVTSNRRSEVESCNGFCKVKTIVLLIRRHDSEEAICHYTLTYIDIKELASRKEESMLQSDHNQLVCSREYARKAYT